MTAIEDRLLAHARVLRSRGLALPPEGQPPAEILDSWVRCTEAGLDMHMPPPLQVIEGGELRQRRERVDYLRRLALAELETLFQQIAGSNFLLAFADADGVILDRYADNRFTMSQSGSQILEGSCWAEALCGTNGLGTALTSGRSVAVNGLEHYLLPLGQISCTATPVHDAEGRVVGVLDASSYFESRQRHTQALVQMAAAQIENRLLVHQLREALVLAIHPRSEFLGTLSAGLLAFDGIGRLRAANARAGALLAGLTLERGTTTFEELFAEPYEHVLARLQRQAEVGLRDALGSRLVARALGGIGNAVGGGGSPARRVIAAAAAPGVALPATHPAASQPPASHPAAEAPKAAIAATARPAAPLPSRPAATAGRAPRIAALPGWVAEDPRVLEALATVEAAVRLQAPIWIQGETGTGKEGLARHAHQASGRTGEFVAVNCAALPAELFEAELFGHVGGAYTGARREGAPGLILSADGGTLLLDEVRELPPPLQAALLRFLDDQQVRPVGGVRSRRVDVQLLAASHADLAAEVAAGHFRADLYHRLCTVQVSLPPLRERSDFATIARSLLAQLDPQADLSMAAIAELRRQPWPGNCRELRAVLTRALLRRPPQGLIEPDTLAPLLAAGVRPAGPLPPAGGSVSAAAAAPLPMVEAGGHAASELQRHATATVRATYELCGGNISLTSRRLGISRTTVYRHLRTAGLAGP